RIVTIAAVLATASTASAAGSLDPPISTTSLGTHNGIAYVRYQGLFRGTTADPTTGGAYLVPYHLEVPADLADANRTVLVEPPHFFGGAGTVGDSEMGRTFFFARGFEHAAVGYGLTDFLGRGPSSDNTILVPGLDCVTHPGPDCVFIDGGD